MSAFSLGQLAAVAGKHPRTMRRWFDLGFFGQAATRTSGGQRRVCGLSAAMLVTSARKQAQGFERARFPKEEKAMRRIKRLARKINRQMANNTARLDRQTRAVANLLGPVMAPLCEMSEEEMENAGLPVQFLQRLMWQTPLSHKLATGVIYQSLALWMQSVQSPSASHVAGAIGVSRRTLCRRFGKYLPHAKRLAGFLPSDQQDSAHDVSDAKSDQDRVTWASMCGYTAKTSKSRKALGGR
jgi:AraC-like DNA-binding protein